MLRYKIVRVCGGALIAGVLVGAIGCAGVKQTSVVHPPASVPASPVVTAAKSVSPADIKQAEVFWKKGVAFSKKKQYKEALAEIDKALALNPKDEEFWYGRGASYLALENCEKALADLNKAIEIRPSFIDAVYLRALAYCLNGDSANAVLDYNRLIAAGEKSDAIYLGRGRSYHQLGQIERARADYMTAIKLDPKNGEARELLKRLEAGKKPGPVKW